MYHLSSLKISLSHRRGTGFFAKLKVNEIDLTCIVTNNHVLPSRESASDGEAIFFYEGSRLGIPFRLEPDKLFHTNEVRMVHISFHFITSLLNVSLLNSQLLFPCNLSNILILGKTLLIIRYIYVTERHDTLE